MEHRWENETGTISGFLVIVHQSEPPWLGFVRPLTFVLKFFLAYSNPFPMSWTFHTFHRILFTIRNPFQYQNTPGWFNRMVQCLYNGLRARKCADLSRRGSSFQWDTFCRRVLFERIIAMGRPCFRFPARSITSLRQGADIVRVRWPLPNFGLRGNSARNPSSLLIFGLFIYRCRYVNKDFRRRFRARLCNVSSVIKHSINKYQENIHGAIKTITHFPFVPFSIFNFPS